MSESQDTTATASAELSTPPTVLSVTAEASSAPDAETPAVSARKSSLDPTLLGLALVTFTIGGVMGLAAFGAAQAAEMSPSYYSHTARIVPTGEEAPQQTAITASGSSDAGAALNVAGEDGEPMDEADAEETVPSNQTTRSNNRPSGALPRSGSSSADAFRITRAGRVTGYIRGRACQLNVTMIDGKAVEQSTADAYRRMRDAAQRAGVGLRVVSGFRTMEHQEQLYALYRSGRGNLAARPGHSNHQSGHALDLNTADPRVRSWLERHGREFGFRRTVPTEPWHWEHW